MIRPDPRGWQPITSAPRDGSLVFVMAQGEWLVMRWNAAGSNVLVQPEPTGIWEAPDGSVTWSEVDGFGPTHWQAHPGGRLQ